MKKSCTLCGCSYGGMYAFKAGHVCESCVSALKAETKADASVRAKN